MSANTNEVNELAAKILPGMRERAQIDETRPKYSVWERPFEQPKHDASQFNHLRMTEPPAEFWNRPELPPEVQS